MDLRLEYKTKTIKLLKEKTEENLDDVGFGEDF